MASALVQTHNLGKAFRIYPRPGDRLREWLSFGRKQLHTLQWAVQEINIQVQAGECIGLIGRNGAGKSSLLRLLSRTLIPTTGTFSVSGQLVSLLELGTGFNLELTGRENVVHTAQLLGFPDGYAKEKMPEIEAFADIGWHMDRPAKTYSSGMLLRVAFAMFAFLESNVLIIDEALAVGDAAFQRKCYRQIEKMLSDPNRAVILVSHDLQSIIKLCSRVYWLDEGRVRQSGNPAQVVTEYLRAMFSSADDRDAVPLMQPSRPMSSEQPPSSPATIPQHGLLTRSPAATIYPSDGAELLGLWLEDQTGQLTATIAVDQPFSICYALRFLDAIDRPVLGIRINTTRGDCMVAINTQMCGIHVEMPSPGQCLIVKWPMRPGLAVGDYFISCGCSLEREIYRFLLREVDGYQFSVVGENRQSGLCSLNAAPMICKLAEGVANQMEAVTA